MEQLYEITEEQRQNRHLKTIGLVYCLVGAGFGLIGLVQAAADWGSNLIMVSFTLAIACLCVALGIGICRHHRVARSIAYVVNSLLLLGFPLGTIFSIYSFLWLGKAKNLFH